MHKFQAILLLTFVALMQSATLHASVIAGVFDTRVVDLDKTHPLAGEWEFYWNTTARTIEQVNQRNLVDFPSLWTDINNKDYPAYGFGTYRMKIVLPDQPGDYALFIDDMYSAYNLYANGRLIAKNGVFSTKQERFYPQWKPQVVSMDGYSGSVVLTLEVANFAHQRGGVSKPPVFGKKMQIDEMYDELVGTDVVIFFLFIFTAIVFFFRFTFTSFDLESLFFSLFCVLYGYRVIGSDYYAIHQFFENIDWYFLIRLEYLTFFLAPLFFGLYIWYLYPNDVSKLLMQILMAICAACALSVVLQPIYFTKLSLPFIAAMLFYFFYGFTVYLSALVNDRTGAIYGLISAIAVFSVFAYAIIVYFGALDYDPQLILFGYLLFLFFQSLQLFKNSVRRTRELTEEI
jgi:hypothetical protein